MIERLTKTGIALLLGLALLPARAAAEQVVRVEVVELSEGMVSALYAETIWLGRSRQVALFDDGEAPDRVLADGVWTAEFRGDPLRMMPLVLHARCADGTEAQIYAGLERLSSDHAVVSLAISEACTLPAMRVPEAKGDALEADTGLLATHGAVFLAVLLFVFGLIRRSRTADQEPDRAWPKGLWFAIWLLLSVAWTYPAAIAGPSLWVGRHFDLPGTVWSLSALPRMDWSLFDGDTGWPRGVHYAQLDSYTLIVFGWLGQLIHPARLHGWLQVGGVAASAWAAQGFARAVGARSPWDALAGLSFAFSGIASHALLEGHVYHLINPWMPLFAWAWWRAMSPEGRVVHGVMAGVFFCLTLLTTVYLGVAAAVIAACFFIGAWWRHGSQVLAPALAAWIPILPVAIGFALVVGGGDPVAASTPIETVQLGSGNMLNMLAPVPTIDFDRHSLAPLISPVTLALMLMAPMVLRGRPGVRVLTWTAIAGLIMGLGPGINADADSLLIPLPMYWIYDIFGARFLRFPVRFFWVWGLCAGVVGALVLGELARRSRRSAGLLLAVAVVYGFFGVRQPMRQGIHLGGAPSAYHHAEGPVLDLFPRGSDRASEEELWFSALACAYQVDHGHPIAENCVATSPESNPRVVLSKLVIDQFLSGEVQAPATLLANLGFDAVALHADWFSPSDSVRLERAIAGMGGPVVETIDAGERVVLVRLSEDARNARRSHNDHIASFDAIRKLQLTGPWAIGRRDEGDGPTTELVVEVREEVEDAGEFAMWIATMTWDDGTHEFKLEDPLETFREVDELTEMRLRGTWSGEIPPRFTLDLRGWADSGALVSEWSGEVQLTGTQEHLMFLYNIQGTWPVPATRALSTPLRRSDAGLLASMFWGVYLLIASILSRLLAGRESMVES